MPFTWHIAPSLTLFNLATASFFFLGSVLGECFGKNVGAYQEQSLPLTSRRAEADAGRQRQLGFAFSLSLRSPRHQAGLMPT